MNEEKLVMLRLLIIVEFLRHTYIIIYIILSSSVPI